MNRVTIDNVLEDFFSSSDIMFLSSAYAESPGPTRRNSFFLSVVVAIANLSFNFNYNLVIAEISFTL